MIPLKDNIPSNTVPFVNYATIAITAMVFLMQVGQGESSRLVEEYGMIPQRVLHPDKPVVLTIEEVHAEDAEFQPKDEPEQQTLAEGPLPAWMTMITCIFLHGGWMHFLGNMWFLWIFGDNVEDRFGHVGYVVFYLAAGVAASATHLLTNMTSPIPTIGASGAIAGVMGAYLVLYPHAKVMSLIPLGFILQMLVLPAPIFLGIWFLLQLVQGVLTISDSAATGVAWWAHIGGFVVGVGAAFLSKMTNFLNPEVTITRRHTSSSGLYRVERHRPGQW